MAGLYFEEFQVGQVFDHAIRRTLTETDNVVFSTMTHNPAPLHLDEEYCREHIFDPLGMTSSSFLLANIDPEDFHVVSCGILAQTCVVEELVLCPVAVNGHCERIAVLGAQLLCIAPIPAQRRSRRSLRRCRQNVDRIVDHNCHLDSIDRRQLRFELGALSITCGTFGTPTATVEILPLGDAVAWLDTSPAASRRPRPKSARSKQPRPSSG